MDVLGKLRELVSIVFQKNDQDITIQPNASTTYTSTTTVNLPDNDAASQELTGNAATQTLTNKTIVAASNTITTAASGNIAATEIDAAIAEGDTNLTNHLNDGTDAHAGSAITNTPAGNLAATDVQGALDELQTELDTSTSHISDPTGAHAANAISNTPSGNLAATDVQGAVDELQTDIDTRATSSALSSHTGDTANPHTVTASQVGLGNVTNVATDDTPYNATTWDANTDAPTKNAVRDKIETLAASADLTSHTGNTTNPHTVTATQVGLGNADNTSDADKPVSTATQTALDGKEDSITATISADYYRGDKTFQTLDKAAVGLGNVDNTSDANKPVSTLQQSEIDTKEDDLGNPVGEDYILQSTVAGVRSWVPNTGGGSGSGEINYITNPDAETDASDWNTYDDGASSTPVDGTGGAASTLTLTAQAVTVLRGNQSFKLAKSAANGQGEGISTDFTIDDADKNKLLKLSFDYNTDGTYANEDIKVYIYDVTNTTLITPADNGLIGKDKDDDSSGARTISWASTDSTSYRLIFHQTTTNASTADLYLDNVIVGPGSKDVGAVVTAWESYTPSNTQGWGTITSRLQWRRVGENVEIKGDFTNGTVTSSEAQIELPNSYTVDYKSSTGANTIGVMERDAATGAATIRWHTLATHGDTFVNFGADSASLSSSTVLPLAGSALTGSSERVVMTASVPVAEFAGSGTVNLMSDNVAAANVRSKWMVNGGSNYAYTANAVMDFDTEATDFTNVGSWSNTNGSITIPADGTYEIKARAMSTTDWADDVTLFVKIGGTSVAEVDRTPETFNRSLGGSVIEKLSKGDVLTITADGSDTLMGSKVNTWLSIVRLADYSAGQPVGFGEATATTPGLVKAPNGMVRLHTANGHGSTNTKVRRFTTAVTNTGSSITYADSSTLGATFTINEAGVYAISYTDIFASSASWGLSLNSSELTTAIHSITDADRLSSAQDTATFVVQQQAWTGRLEAGDIIRAHTSGASDTNPDRVNFTITQVAAL